MRSTGSCSTLTNSDGKITSDPNIISNLFNNYFSSVFIKDDGCRHDFIVPNINNSFSDIHITRDDIMEVISALKSKHSSGLDGLSSFLVKKLCVGLINTLFIIFGYLLQTGTIPDEWRFAYVWPLFKSGSPLSVCNYRPISLTSVICKILERIIKKYILDFFINNDLIYEINFFLVFYLNGLSFCVF